MLNKLTLIIMSFALLLFGCGGGEEVATYEGKIEDAVNDETDVKLDMVVYDIPTPVEVTKDIAASGASYNNSLLNNPSKAGSYATTYKKAVNLGIYIADLSYAAVNDQTQDATNYLSAANKLAESLGIDGAFNQEMVKAFQDNLGNKDTLTTLIDLAYKNADKYLRSNDRVSTAALVLAGGWVEGMYLSTKILGNEPKTADNRLIFERIGGQKLSLNNLVDLLENYKDKPDINNAYGPLAELDSVVYNKIQGPSAISRGQVDNITSRIEALRNEMIK